MYREVKQLLDGLKFNPFRLSISPLFRFQDSALVRRLGMLVFSCSSSRTYASIKHMTSLAAIEFIFIVVIFILVFLETAFQTEHHARIFAFLEH